MALIFVVCNSGFEESLNIEMFVLTLFSHKKSDISIKGDIYIWEAVPFTKQSTSVTNRNIDIRYDWHEFCNLNLKNAPFSINGMYSTIPVLLPILFGIDLYVLINIYVEPRKEIWLYHCSISHVFF